MAPRAATITNEAGSLEDVAQAPEERIPRSSVGHLEPDGVRRCCGNTVEPTLTRFPSSYRGNLFLALWSCPVFGEFSAEYRWKETVPLKSSTSTVGTFLLNARNRVGKIFS